MLMFAGPGCLSLQQALQLPAYKVTLANLPYNLSRETHAKPAEMWLSS